LLFLAISGIFMLRGMLGIRGRGAILILAGAAVPILYVTFANGPGGCPCSARSVRRITS